MTFHDYDWATNNRVERSEMVWSFTRSFIDLEIFHV